MAAAADRREGRAFPDIARDIRDPSTLRLVESWRDQAAFDAHIASDAIAGAL